MNLDDVALLKAADPGKVLASIEAMGSQCEAATAAVGAASLSDAMVGPSQIVVAGMGGSALGAEIASALLAPSLRAPIAIVRDYTLPAWVGAKTLVVLSSYSGTTEETLAAADTALARTGLVVGISGGGELAAKLAARGRPTVMIDPADNPCGQPRFALAASLFALLGILDHARVAERFFDALGGCAEAARAGAAFLDSARGRYGVATPRASNLAKETALFLEGRGTAVVASEHLAGNARVLSNQLNETAKSYAVAFAIPELNHHLMEGLQFPEMNRGALAFLFVESSLYGARVRARYAATREVVARQGVPEKTLAPAGETPMFEALDTLLLSSYLAFYLALRNKQDPAKIPWVDYFKERLSLSSSEEQSA